MFSWTTFKSQRNDTASERISFLHSKSEINYLLLLSSEQLLQLSEKINLFTIRSSIFLEKIFSVEFFLVIHFLFFLLVISILLLRVFPALFVIFGDKTTNILKVNQWWFLSLCTVYVFFHSKNNRPRFNS